MPDTPNGPPPLTDAERKALAALGRRRQALMTPDERREFARLGRMHSAEAHRNRTRAERAAIARKGVMTRRMAPAWMRKASQKAAAAGECTKDSRETVTQPTQDRPASHPETPAAAPTVDLDALAAAIDALDDDAIADMAKALAAKIGA